MKTTTLLKVMCTFLFIAPLHKSTAINKKRVLPKKLESFKTVKGPQLITKWNQKLDVMAWPEYKGEKLIMHFSVYENGEAINNKNLFSPENRGLKNAFPFPNQRINGWNNYYSLNGNQIMARSYEILEPQKGAAIVTWTLKNGTEKETFSMVIRTTNFAGRMTGDVTFKKTKIKQKNVFLLKQKLSDEMGLSNPKIWNRPHIQIVPSNYDQIKNVSYQSLTRMTGAPLPDNYHFKRGETIYISDSNHLHVFDIPFNY